MKRLKHVHARLQFVLALRDCLRDLGDLCRDPAVRVRRVDDRQVVEPADPAGWLAVALMERKLSICIFAAYG